MFGAQILLQLTIELSKIFAVFFFLLEIVTLVYKVNVLPYPTSRVATDLSLLILLGLFDAGRLLLGSRGNRRQLLGQLYLSGLLTFFVASLCVFFILGQTYLIYFEIIGIIVELSLCFFQCLFCILNIYKISRPNKIS